MWAKLIIGATFLGVVTGAILFTAHQLGTWPNCWGIANFILFNLIIAWYLLDVMVPRRSIYRCLGDSEDPIKLEVRLFRKVVLLAIALIGASAAGLDVYQSSSPPEGAPAIYIPESAQNSLFILTGIFIAAFGWMYTGFQKEKADRITNTLGVIRDQMYGDHIATVYRQMSALIKHARTLDHCPEKGVLPEEVMELRLKEVPVDKRPEGHDTRTLGYVADQFMNALDHIAFGVRQGQFDLRTVEMVLRPRFVRHAYIFSDYIRTVTDAVEDEALGRYRSTKRTWEHLLWLVTKLPIVSGDKISETEERRIVLPPDHIVEAHDDDDADVEEQSAE